MILPSGWMRTALAPSMLFGSNVVVAPCLRRRRCCPACRRGCTSPERSRADDLAREFHARPRRSFRPPGSRRRARRRTVRRSRSSPCRPCRRLRRGRHAPCSERGRSRPRAWVEASACEDRLSCPLARRDPRLFVPPKSVVTLPSEPKVGSRWPRAPGSAAASTPAAASPVSKTRARLSRKVERTPMLTGRSTPPRSRSGLAAWQTAGRQFGPSAGVCARCRRRRVPPPSAWHRRCSPPGST